MKQKVQSFGRFLSGMVMPNIGAFIAWGLLTALFISSGWLPNEQLSTMVSPMLTYILPVLIAFQGGKMVGGDRGSVIAVIATVGVICGTEYTMLMGAMVMGPFAGWVIKQFDKAVAGHIPPGFEMLVNNFSIGIIGLILAIIGFYVIGPFMAAVLVVLSGGVQALVTRNLLPLISVFVEPAKVLFLNNAINHGIFTPLGIEDVKATGRSIFYMIETNPGAGTGVLLAYWLFAKDKATRDSAPGALIVHLFGGIHEIYFPYILMNPLLLLATIGGSVTAMLYNMILGLGLASPASPGSILAYVGMAPKGSSFAVLLSAVIACAVSFIISVPIIKMSGNKGGLESAQAQMQDMKAASKGLAGAGAATSAGSGSVDLRTIDRIVFACDAGMGSSAMGAAVMQRKLASAGFGNIKVSHASVSEVPAGTELVICHQDLAERAAKSAPGARLVTITNFMNAPEYDALVNEIIDARTNKHSEKDNQDANSYRSGLLLKKNIIINHPTAPKEDIIREIGKIFYEGGYTTEKYTQAMLDKEPVFNTAIGNGLAIPHGIESMRGEIKNSGLVIMTFPQGIDWGGEIVKLVIGIAAIGEDHLDVLGKIADACDSEEEVDAIVAKSVDEIYDMFKRS
ncbi:MAG: PTS mannitol transporter subunit IICBA [Lachnospiraceae bacterium]|nr:PTS mannitol transporter subunit IICBA [Lachnospiraceae bacterium]